jgi:hypothetical protein
MDPVKNAVLGIVIGVCVTLLGGDGSRWFSAW